MNRCLACYQPLNGSGPDFHVECTRRFFGNSLAPEIPYDLANLEEMALTVVRSRIVVPGVQPKLSLKLEKPSGKEPRFTLVGLFGQFILKPPVAIYPELPELEDLTMHLASFFKMRVVPHTLVRLRSGELAYLTKRIDRKKQQRVHMEDMAQLLGFLTEDKYKGSAERIGKAILQFSSSPGLDSIRFLEILIFSFLTGNADMHLKNFSLIYAPTDMISLAPAYDLVPTKLLIPEDNEEMAIPLNGKKSRLKKRDFLSLAAMMNIPDKAVSNIFERMEKGVKPALNFIDQSFLSPQVKGNYKNLLLSRATRIF